MKKEYRQIYDNITPDEKTVEATLEKVGENKARNFVYRRVGAAALALTLLCGTVGGYYAFNKNNEQDNITVKTAISDTSDRIKNFSSGGIMIAYAKSQKPISIEKLDIEEMPVYANLTLIDLTASQSEIDEKEKYFNKISATESYVDENSDKSIGIRTSSCHTSDDKAVLYSVNAGEFILDIDDYSKVERITVSNKSKYGQMVINYADKDGELNFIHTKKCVLTGEQIKESISSKIFECGLGEYERNDGYEITWRHSTELCEDIEENHSFDISSIEDEAIFEVLYKNGDVSRASVKISFDEKGDMKLENGGYNYYNK